ncbi:zinc finger, CCHC-type containing protein [Tanacetum coccineum]
MDGNVHTYKSCLVAKGFTQTYGVDYEEKFSPVADRILIAIATFYDYEICKMDVKTAFLNGYLDEDIYMVQPEEKLDLNKTQGASTPEEVKRMQNVPYASANLGELHWTAVKAILKYLRNTKDMFLVYGYVFILNGGAVDWKSSKQITTAMSATEAEYIAASEAGMEAVCIRKFISWLGIVPTINEPIKMFCDNSAALHFANELGVQKGVDHYHRRYHYLRKCFELGEIKLLKVRTDDNLADPFTKALSKGKLTQHARSMGLCLASSFM